MTGGHLKMIRMDLGLSLVDMGCAIGFAGSPETVNRLMRRYEQNEKPVPSWIGRLAIMYHRHGLPPDHQFWTDTL